MRYAKIIFLLLGLCLLAWVLSEANLAEIWRQVSAIHVAGLIAIFLIYAAYFGADVIGWQVTLETVELTPRWTGRLYLVRMIGEAYNNITPMASMGGEPIKAWLLKNNYNIPLRDAGASLVTAKTASMFSLVIFTGIALAIALQHGSLGDSEKLTALIGFAWLVFNVVVFYLMQHLRLSSFTATRLGNSRLGKRLERVIGGMQGVDEQFARFYGKQRSRLFWSMAYAMVNWLLGVAELMLILHLLGQPISWWDAWLIEALVQIIKIAVFFIPAGIGAQEGAIMLACASLCGSPNVGIAAALVRRFRELVWIGVSLTVASLFHVDRKMARRVDT